MIAIWLSSLPWLLAMALAGWLYAYKRSNVNIVDTLWPLFFLAAATVYAAQGTHANDAAQMLMILIAVWSVRLAVHLTVRNAGKEEDHRYQSFRRKNPRFALHSLWSVFGLQAALAWLISVPLAAAFAHPVEFGVLHAVAMAVFVVGFGFETVADWQLTRFKRDPNNRGQVLDTGVWRYSRHPNYFGEACIWWSFYLFAVAADSAWTIVAPLLMTFLLLRVSGVVMLEKDIAERRPDYRHYVKTTSAFIPWPPSHRSDHSAQGSRP